MQLVKPHALDLGFSTIVLSRNLTLFIVHCGESREQKKKQMEVSKHRNIKKGIKLENIVVTALVLNGFINLRSFLLRSLSC